MRLQNWSAGGGGVCGQRRSVRGGRGVPTPLRAAAVEIKERWRKGNAAVDCE